MSSMNTNNMNLKPFPPTKRDSVPRIIILTGAGISAESGISTFRDRENGLWTRYNLEDVATPQAYHLNPSLVLEFYSTRRAMLNADIKPNAAHCALAHLQQNWPDDSHFLLITQNVDHLHEKAGSTGVLHLHGELFKTQCMGCGVITVDRNELSMKSCCQNCGKVGMLRPHVVWFGEKPFEMRRIEKELACCDIFVAIGTSGSVYPAAGFVAQAGAAGARTIELNLEPSDVNDQFHERRYGPASKVVPEIVDELLRRYI